jgi:hypothetical protein
MLDKTELPSSEGTVRFKARVEDGVLIPESNISLPEGTFWVSLQREPAEEAVDALDEILALAQPLGPADLARNFDSYTGRVIADETSA